MDDDKVVVGGGLRVLGVRLRTGLIKKKKKIRLILCMRYINTIKYIYKYL